MKLSSAVRGAESNAHAGLLKALAPTPIEAANQRMLARLIESVVFVWWVQQRIHAQGGHLPSITGAIYSTS